MVTKLIFTNEIPPISNQDVYTHSERREQLLSLLEEFIGNHERFNGEEIKLTFLGNNRKSLVVLIQTLTEQLVFKSPLSTKHSTGEARFLEVWQQAGVRTPHVVEEGLLGENPYLLLEYVAANPWADAYDTKQLLAAQRFVTLGKMLRTMHEPLANGYGQVVDGKAEYATFEQWLNNPSFQKNIAYSNEHQLFNESHGLLTDAIATLKAFTERENSSSYCHGDFYTENVLDSQPLTVIDPNPRFGHSYIDLAWTIFIAVRRGDPAEVRQQFLEGYFGNEHYDTEVLRAIFLLHAYTRLPYSHRSNKIEQVQNIQEFLASNPHTLIQ